MIARAGRFVALFDARDALLEAIAARGASRELDREPRLGEVAAAASRFGDALDELRRSGGGRGAARAVRRDRASAGRNPARSARSSGLGQPGKQSGPAAAGA